MFLWSELSVCCCPSRNVMSSCGIWTGVCGKYRMSPASSCAHHWRVSSDERPASASAEIVITAINRTCPTPPLPLRKLSARPRTEKHYQAQSQYARAHRKSEIFVAICKIHMVSGHVIKENA